jgi:hypothetical protein
MSRFADDKRAGFRRLALTTGLIVFSIIVALIVAELITRIVAPQLAPSRADRVLFWSYDAALGWAHRPNKKGRFARQDFSVEVSINSAGLRDDELMPGKSEQNRMLVLGDSFGWGYGVEHRERFDTLLEQRNPDWDFINASVSGYGTDQQYLWLKENGDKYQADALMLLMYQNDFTNNAAVKQYWYNKPRFELRGGELELTNVPVPPATIEQRIQRALMGRTYLYGYLYLKVVFPLEIQRDLARQQRLAQQGGATAESAGSFAVTAELINAIRAYCAQRSMAFVLVSVPSEPRYREFFADYASTDDIAYLALDETFADKDIRDYLIARDNHWNANGHAIAAAAIEAYLQHINLL